MATSSIIDNITIHNPKVLEEWLESLERLAENPVTEIPRSNVCTDPEVTREFMKKALARMGIEL